ncbi:hypothetical protein G6F43_010625 [Rhizopus delemar]|nr:hypothetical protein G6F43_010625 [Rhizopus delemar]
MVNMLVNGTYKYDGKQRNKNSRNPTKNDKSKTKKYKKKEGPVVCHYNLYLAQDPYFRADIAAFCINAEHFLPGLDTPLLWDLFKRHLKSFIQSFSHKAAVQCHRNLNKLQRIHKRLLRQPTDDETNAQLASVESQLELQYEHSSMLVLRSSQRWKEQGERSNTYFYRCLRQRQQQQYISSIRIDTGIVVTESLDITEIAREYYEQLYYQEPLDEQAESDLHAHVPDSASITPEVHGSLFNY